MTPTRGNMTCVTLWVVLLLLHLLNNVVIARREVISGAKQYCQWETFNATCNSNEIILMKVAKYGRMRFGGCIKENHGHIGCSADVISHLDRICSGQRHCQLSIPDPSLHKLHACPKELMSYLEADYECVQVAMNEGQVCGRSRPLELTQETGYIASSVAEETGFGALHCPWLVRVHAGRTLTFTLYHFALDTEVGKTLRGCETILNIKEASKSRNITLCGGDPRGKDIYISSTNVVQIAVIPAHRITQPTRRFVVKYRAMGCPDLPLSNSYWVERDHTKSIVRCNFTEETFFLSCESNSWVGEMGNCSNASAWKGRGLHKSQGRFPYGILVVIGIGVAMGVAMGIILLMAILVCIRRRKRRNLKSATTDPLLDDLSHDLDDAHGQCHCGAKIYYSTALECQLATMRAQHEAHVKHSSQTVEECPTMQRELNCIPEHMVRQHQQLMQSGEHGPMPDMCILEKRSPHHEGQNRVQGQNSALAKIPMQEQRQEQTSFITFKPLSEDMTTCSFHSAGLPADAGNQTASHYGTLTKAGWTDKAFNLDQTKSLLPDTCKQSLEKEGSDCARDKWTDSVKVPKESQVVTDKAKGPL